MDIKSVVCMANTGKYKKYTSHIDIRVNLVRNGGNWKMHKIDWCEGSLKLADIVTKNFGEKDLNPRMKYIIVSLEKWEIKLVQEGWKDTE